MYVKYCKFCNHMYYSNRIENYCRKCKNVLVEVDESFKELTEMNINERYKLAYKLSKKG